MTDANGSGDGPSDGLTRRNVLSMGAGVAGSAVGLSVLSGTAAAWRRFQVDFRACEEVRLVIHEEDLDFSPPAVAHVIVAVDSETACRTVECTPEAATTFPDSYGTAPVIAYTADAGETILGVIEYNYRDDRFSEPVCVLPNDNACADDVPSFRSADCVQAGVDGYWNGEVRECWDDPLDGPAGDGADQPRPLVPSDAGADSWVGHSVAINDDGDVLILGAPGKDDADRGLVAVYRRRDGEWVESGTLPNPDGVYQFGRSVALNASGDVALVGGDGLNPDTHFTGPPAIVLEYDGTSWSKTGELSIPEAELREEWRIGGFGESVALDAAGDTAVVGAPSTRSQYDWSAGQAYIFERDSDGWTFERRGSMEITIDDRFGTDVALAANGRRAFMSAPEHRSPEEGRVRVANRTDDGWVPGAELTKDDDERWNRLGASIDANDAGTLLAAGDPTDDVDGREFQGSVSVYDWQDGGWSSGTTITASDGDENDGFGTAVATNADGSVLLVGAPPAIADPPYGPGVLYRFVKQEGTWVQTATFGRQTGGSRDGFGQAVALDAAGDTAVCSAPEATVDGVQTGAVHVYEV